MSPDTSCSFGIHIDCISVTLQFIYVTVNLYPFVSSNKLATNWQQFCRQFVARLLLDTKGYKSPVADTRNMSTSTNGYEWIQLVSGNMCPGVKAALEMFFYIFALYKYYTFALLLYTNHHRSLLLTGLPTPLDFNRTALTDSVLLNFLFLIHECVGLNLFSPSFRSHVSKNFHSFINNN